MNIELRTIPHPHINRDVTVLYINNKLDIPSSKFLVYEARYGGRRNLISATTTNKTRAIKIAELYRHLDDLGLNWRTAREGHIKAIRNAMLCWDKNNNKDYGNYDYDPISNNVMNTKISTWFKFYNYMKLNGEESCMIMTTRKVEKFSYKGMNYHLNIRTQVPTIYTEVWSIKVPSSPINYTYNAISRTEYEHLFKYLEKIDIVFALLSLLMVETGLRITAALQIKQEEFKGYLKYINAGKSINDFIKVDYIAKGGNIKKFDLPLRTIIEIKKNYLSRIYLKRMKAHSDRSKKIKSCTYNPEALWLLENGREINKNDIQRAFQKASIQMGYKRKKITPHWMRHTFATWSLIDFANEQNIKLQNTGTVPNPMFMLLLQEKMGHQDSITTMRYIATALKLMKIGSNNGPIKVSFRTFEKDLRAQELVKREAIYEFQDEFDDELFDVFDYAISRGIVVKDEI